MAKLMATCARFRLWGNSMCAHLEIQLVGFCLALWGYLELDYDEEDLDRYRE